MPTRFVSRVRRLGGWLLLTAILADQALAALPVPVAPSTAPGGDDFLGQIKGYSKDAALVLGLVISVAGFVWVGWHLLADLNQVRSGRKEFGELGLGAVVGAVVLLVVSYFLGKASNII